MVAETLEALLLAVGAPAGGPDDALGLGSLAVVQLVDLLEATWEDLHLRSADVRRENFETRRALLGLLASKGIS